jgi:hypothetical protein
LALRKQHNANRIAVRENFLTNEFRTRFKKKSFSLSRTGTNFEIVKAGMTHRPLDFVAG